MIIRDHKKWEYIHLILYHLSQIIDSSDILYCWFIDVKRRIVRSQCGQREKLDNKAFGREIYQRHSKVATVVYLSP